MPKFIRDILLARLNAKGIMHYYQRDDLTGMDMIVYYKGIDTGIARVGHRPPVPKPIMGIINSDTTQGELAWLK